MRHSSLLSCCIGIVLLAQTGFTDDDFQQLLTSASGNVNVVSATIQSADVTPDCKIPWRVTKRSLAGGKQQGVDLITIDNGKLQISVIPTRGMSVLDVMLGDVRLGWDSPVKEVVHPQFVNLESRGGLGWLEGFNEWMVRCGLEFAGHPGEDKFINNTGDEASMNLTLHGKIGNIAASEVELIVDRRPPHRIRLRGVVHERSFYGPKLELVTEISTEPGSETFRIDDTITNHGAFDQEFTIIYHGNYGRPLLEAGAEVVTAAKRVMPMNDHAAKSVAKYSQYQGPTTGFVEEVYLVEPLADSAGQASVLLRNAAGNRGTSIRWQTVQLPYLTIWKNTAAEADGYVTGLEPGTCFPYNRSVERRAGRLPKLAPGATRRFTLDFGIHIGTEAVQAEESRIAALQRSSPPQIETAPPQTANE